MTQKLLESSDAPPRELTPVTLGSAKGGHALLGGDPEGVEATGGELATVNPDVDPLALVTPEHAKTAVEAVVVRIDLANITIPSKRMRALGDITALMQSIDNVGLLNPVVLTMEDRLVAGLHRIEAVKALGWTQIEARRMELSEIDARLAEIDENLIRSELTALERAENQSERKKLYLAKHPETKAGGDRKSKRIKSVLKPDPFTTDTAAKTKVSRSSVEQYVKIAQSLPEGVKQLVRGTPVEDHKNDLLKLARMEKPEQLQVAKEIAGGAKSVKDAKKALNRRAKTPTAAELKKALKHVRLIHAECKDLDLPDNSVDCIITDPPYPEEFLPCYSDLSALAARVLKPGGACIVMCGQSYLLDVGARLREHLTYHWTVTYLTPGGQSVQLWDRKVNTFWKPLL